MDHHQFDSIRSCGWYISHLPCVISSSVMTWAISFWLALVLGLVLSHCKDTHQCKTSLWILALRRVLYHHDHIALGLWFPFLAVQVSNGVSALFRPPTLRGFFSELCLEYFYHKEYLKLGLSDDYHYGHTCLACFMLTVCLRNILLI